MSFEYIDVHHQLGCDLLELLNHYGQDGWQVVMTRDDDEYLIIYFMRKI